VGVDSGNGIDAAALLDRLLPFRLLLTLLWPRKRAGSGGTGGTSGEDMRTGRERGVPKLQRPMAAARSASSSSPVSVSTDEGRVSVLDWREWEKAGECRGALLVVKELEGTDWYECEKDELLVTLKRFPPPYPSSPIGGGVVSAELRPPRSSDDAAGDADEPSDSASRDSAAAAAEASWFMLIKTVAASSNWTCWCLEMSSFEV